ncbi:MAG: septal ring lytic transglycosylase RlpA family protein [Gammaproteobacteria bacterium]
MKPRHYLLLLISISFAACSTNMPTHDGPPRRNIDVSKIPNATPHVEHRSKTVNPESYVVLGKRYHVLKSELNYDKTGIASWYGTKFNHHRTSDGEMYDMLGMTAASKELPLPCYAKVTNLKNGRQVIVKVNDRGPFHENRIIDLSYTAAKKLGLVGHGTGLVRVTGIDPLHYQSASLPYDQSVSPHSQPKMYVQLGAYSQRAHAQSYANTVSKQLHQQVVVKKKSIHQKTLYVAVIGPIASQHNNDQLVSKLKKQHIQAMTVVMS